MQKILLSIILVLLPFVIGAQQINLEFGRVISKFDYKNSAGEKLENIQGSSNNHLGLSIALPVRKSDLYFVSGIGYNNYKSQFSDEQLGNYYRWDVNYLSINVGTGYEFLKTNSLLNLKNTNSESGFTCFVQFNTGMEFLVQGTQTINNLVYNLKGVEQFNKPLLIVQGGAGARYYASKSISVFLQYMGGKSFSIFKSDSESSEKLNITTHIISLGVSVHLPASR